MRCVLGYEVDEKFKIIFCDYFFVLRIDYKSNKMVIEGMDFFIFFFNYGVCMFMFVVDEGLLCEWFGCWKCGCLGIDWLIDVKGEEICKNIINGERGIKMMFVI